MPPHLRSHRSSTPSDLIWAWLWQACGNNHTAVVDLLLRNLKWVVNTNAQDMHGSTALFAATGKGNTEVVRMLLNHNADPADPNLLYLYHDRKLGPTSLTALDLAQVANLVHGGACTSKHLHEDLHARAYILVNTYLGMKTLSTWFILLTVLDPVQRHPRFLWEESQNRKHAVAALLLEHGAQNASSLSR